MRSIILSFLVMFGAPIEAEQAGFHPDQQPAIVERSGDYTVRLRRDGQSLRFSASNRGRTVINILLPSDVAQVNSIHFVTAKRVALLGAATGDLDVVVIFDFNSARIVDKFWCYGMSLSPDKRFLAFIKFFPAHFVEGVSDVYLLYDFHKSPSENRASDISISDVQNVGTVIYPAGLKNKNGDNTGRPESEIHMLESGAFFWSADGDQLAFVDRFQGKLSVILATFSEDKFSFNLKESEIKKSDVCLSPDIDRCNFAATSIQFSNRDHLKLKIRPYNFQYPVKGEIDMAM